MGDEIATAVSTLTASLSGGARSGTDPAGAVFGHSYQQLAQGLLDAGAEAVNAGRSVGFGVQMSATNYSRADAASTIGGAATALAPPDTPAEFSAPAAPSAQGGGVPPPLLWSVIQSFIPDVWPDGDPASLRSTGNAWQTFATAIGGIAGHLTGPSGVVGSQQIPEGGAMTTAITKLTESLNNIATEAGNLATQTLEFADDVENTQNAIRDLLDRVSPSGFLDGLKAVFSGDALEELKEVADDVKTVLGGYGRQAEARRDVLQIAMGAVDDAIVSVEQWARREFPKYLGDDVGNALATSLDFQLTLRQGILAGAVDTIDSFGQLDPLRFAYDPEGAKDAWAGMAESLGESLLYATPTGIMSNPVGAFNHYKDQAADVVHAEDWSSERSGFGLGKILFDVGAAAIPGGAAARGTKAAVDAGIDAPSPGRTVDGPGGASNFTSATQRVDDITQSLDELGNDVRTAPMSTPGSGPRIPDELANPTSTPEAPRIPDSRSAPGAAAPLTPDSAPGDRSPAPQSSAPVDRSQEPQISTPVGTSPQSSGGAPGDQPLAPHSSAASNPPAHLPAGELPGAGALGEVDAPSAPSQTASSASPSSVGAGAQAPSNSLEGGSAGIGPSPATTEGSPAPDSASSDYSASGNRSGAGMADPPSSAAPESDATGSSPYDDGPAGVRSTENNGGPPLGTDHSGEAFADNDVSQRHDHGLSDAQRNEILAAEKGSRPDPSEYLTPEYIEEHLRFFEDGASRFMTADNLRDYGIGQRDGTTFVFPTSELDALMNETAGDRRALERALGLPEGYFESYEVVRIDIPDPENHGLRIPSGNEAGANDQWIPGGLLPQGMPEAVVDGRDIPDDDYLVTDIPE
ncbi:MULTISPECIES: hypothetical protein [unclassified Mycobacterium]|uniref:WXG100-like domain-containing protein n=1 Tax=unclassified Mycobacterium TaxID=2642494 RepID=UPI0007415724|nr:MULTISPECIES: hypothetical protein [unclassified Mycobacterium]KUH81290.1 hypothetical protein AU187_00810 [Mycobacterium sp. IS-1556]KUH89536.1 hypothetical protein AU185_14815 [Mycobacterium sp. GA-0227b]